MKEIKNGDYTIIMIVCTILIFADHLLCNNITAGCTHIQLLLCTAHYSHYCKGHLLTGEEITAQFTTSMVCAL